ncbi:BatD family protein [Spirosoma taeanense]|uniref:BatD family protein n=1 Tax=Spirosoma taeanense TaxID=2735870 RepID=UPI001F03E01B|nr:BatD family protein [Spirosoma taeanense]
MADNTPAIEFSALNFPIERPFTISVSIPDNENRPTILFPDIPGFTKKGTSTSVTTSEVGGETITNQVISQSYQAMAAGRFRLPPFVLIINGVSVRSEGAVLVVRSSAAASAPASSTLTTVAVPPNGAAFLALRTSRSAIYTGEAISLTLAFFVANNYPYELNITNLDKQLQEITRSIRPANAWEENVHSADLKAVEVLVGGKKFREYKLYKAIFFPLAAQPIRLPSVSIRLARPRPVIGPPTAQTEYVSFSSKPLTVNVQALPAHPLRGRVPVGSFVLEEKLDRQRVGVGKSVRYSFSIVGEGNIAALPEPDKLDEAGNADIFPPEEQHVINQNGNQVTGSKTFTYFVVPRQNGIISLANRFQWIYFDLQKERYDTLRPKMQLHVGGSAVAQEAAIPEGELAPTVPSGNSLYAGIDALDSNRQPVSISVLIRAVANVLIVLMLLGIIFVFFKR